MIQLKNLTKKYQKQTVVNQLTLDIHQGELFSLLGQNGAGKTTTIRMLCCLVKPTGGEAWIGGNSILTRKDQVHEIINVSPQETAVSPRLTVEENLCLMAEIYGFHKEQAKQKAEEMMNRFSLTERKGERAKKLSGGLMRKLSIAMALISNPKVLFLDEPTLGLDVRARRELWKLIEELKGKMTIVLTTHYLEEAEALSDRVGIISRGEMKAVGTVDELKQQTGKETLEDIFLLITEDEQ